jgi:glycine cleavage system H protein
LQLYPEDLRYTREHEWIRVTGDEGVIGITHYAQQELGDVVYVDVPAVGQALQAGKPFGVVESVKSVSDLFAPVSGTVTRVNAQLADAPELVNKDPYGEGWMIAVRIADPKELDALLDAAAYRALVEGRP